MPYSTTTHIAVASRKGGVGKTTTAVNTAALLAAFGYSTLLVDLDRQGQSAVALGLDPAPNLYLLFATPGVEPLPLITGARPDLALLPGNGRTVSIEAIWRAEGRSLDEAARLLQAVAAGYDVVLYDCPPQGLLQELALYVADLLIIPAPCDYLSLDGMADMLAAAVQVGEKFGRMPTQTLILPTLVDARTREARRLLADLQGLAARDAVAVHAPIPASVAVKAAAAEGKTVNEYAPANPAALAYEALAETLSAEYIGKCEAEFTKEAPCRAL